ncbi:MAG: ComEC/Rec2 family competence protein [Clostridia bacterium]|nr:ComEC/Rec2 family competence protein [Clostridia bacterium]
MLANLGLIVLAMIFSILMRSGQFLPLVAVFIVLMILFKWYFELEWVRLSRMVAIGFCVGCFSLSLFHNQVARIPYGVVQDYEVTVTAFDAAKGRYTLALTERVYRSILRKPLVFVKALPMDVAIGDALVIKGSIMSFDLPSNPGESNFRQIYYGKMIVGTFKSMEMVKRLDGKRHQSVLAMIDALRMRMARQMKMTLKDSHVGYALGMAIGDKSGISKDDEGAMRNLGLSHVLVVSSLHVGLVVVLLNQTLGRIHCAKLWTHILAVTIILVLYFVSFSKIAIAKCLFIYILHALALHLDRKPCYFVSIALFVFGALCYNPYLLYNLSFTLSLMAYVGVFGYYRYTWHDKGKLIRIWYLTFCIYMMLLPVLATSFGGVQLLGVLVAPLIMPFIELLLGLNFVNVCVQTLVVFRPLSMVMARFFDVLDMLVAISGRMGDGFLMLPYGNLLVYTLIYVLIGLLSVRRKLWRPKIYGILLGLLVTVVAGCVTVHHFPMRVIYLDVGMGDSALIYQGRTSVLIDGGTKYQTSVLNNAMTYLGEGKIDVAVLSHEHQDHYGGILALIESDRIETVYMTPMAYDALKTMSPALEVYRRAGRLFLVEKSTSLNLYKKWTLTLIPPNLKDDNPNNQSMMCLLQRGSMDFLFTGDAEVAEEERMLPKLITALNGRVEYLKVPHHGSDTASAKSFLLATQPNYGIISVGKDNAYGLPDESTTASYLEMGTTLHRTDLSGALELRIVYPWVQQVGYKRD